MIQNYPDKRSQSCKRAKQKKNYGKNSRIIHKIREKFVQFANYSGLIRSKFSQPNNLAFSSTSPKKRIFKFSSQIIFKSCDYDHCMKGSLISVFFPNLFIIDVSLFNCEAQSK